MSRLRKKAAKIPERETPAAEKAGEERRLRQALANEYARGYLEGWQECQASILDAQRLRIAIDESRWVH